MRSKAPVSWYGLRADTARREPAATYCVPWTRYDDYIARDIVSHMEFFYNTLLCSHSTQNPFRHPLAYPALNYPVFKDMSGAPTQTILQFHRQLIFPERNEEMLACSESTPSKSINTSNMSRPNMDAT